MTHVIRCSVILVLLLLCELVFGQEAWAWGPGVHTLSALISLNQVQQLSPLVAGVVSSYPLEFLYGCLAADFFIGKGRRKRGGHPHTWEGGFQFLSEAGEGQEEAYAFGFLSHLAADVVAHNYFIPNLIYAAPIRRKRAHLMLEIKADYFVGPGYTKIAREVLRMGHQGCDDLLILLSGKKINGLRVKKRIFTQSVILTEYLHATRSILFPGRIFYKRVFNDYLAFMVDLSCRLVIDLLKHPDSSPCLAYDPLGRRNLGLAKARGSFVGLLSNRRPPRKFTVDQELLAI